MAGQPAGVTEEPTYSAVLTRISLGVGSSSEFEEEELEEEEVEDDEAEATTMVESVRPALLRPLPSKLAPRTGSTASARQRASVRAATRSRRGLLRGAEEASKGGREGMPWPIVDDGIAAALAVAAAVAAVAGALFVAKVRCVAAAEDRRDIAARVQQQLLSIKERERELEKKEKATNLLAVAFFFVRFCVFCSTSSSSTFFLSSPLPNHPPSPLLQRPRVLSALGQDAPGDLLGRRCLPPLGKVEARPLGARRRRQAPLEGEKVFQLFF